MLHGRNEFTNVERKDKNEFFMILIYHRNSRIFKTPKPCSNNRMKLSCSFSKQCLALYDKLFKKQTLKDPSKFYYMF